MGVVAALNKDRFTPDFVEERRQFLGFSLTEMPAKLPFYLQQLAAHFDWLQGMLDRGGQFLLGDAPSAADLTAYHTIWFMRQNGGGRVEELLPIGKLVGWYDRMTGIGHGRPQDLSSAAALAIAQAADPAPPHVTGNGDPSGLKLGQRLMVTPDDMGRDPVVGVLVAADSQEIIVRRNDEKTGEMQVHFPRAGFEAKPA